VTQPRQIGQEADALMYSHDSERVIEGTWFLPNGSLHDVLAKLPADKIYGRDAREIHTLACESHARGEPIDIWLSAQKLARGSELEQRRLVALMSEAVDFATGDRGLLEHHMENIQEFHARRSIRDFALELAKKAVGKREADELFAQTSGFLESQRSQRQSNDWKLLFHTREETKNAPPAQFAIEGFLQQDAITLLGALPGHGKTLCMLAMVRALLEGGKLFHYFQVSEQASRVIYLIPECGLPPFASRLKLFRLERHVGDRLFYRTLSSKGSLALTDPLLLEAANGADVFLDTAIRFMGGLDENSSGEQRLFADTLFALQKAGARTITGAHHSPKSFSKDSFMTLENVLRGSGDIGAMAATCWGLSQIDPESNSVFIQNVKPRDFQPCDPFIVKARPTLDQTGYFELVAPPGFAGELGDHKSKGGRHALPDKQGKRIQALQLKEQGMSVRAIARELEVSIGTAHGLVAQQ